jgi:hypothetical protein
VVDRLAGVTLDSQMAALAAERRTAAMHTARPQRAATSKLVTASLRRSTRAAPCRRLATSVASSIGAALFAVALPGALAELAVVGRAAGVLGRLDRAQRR